MSKKYPEAHDFFGAYFHQDWTVDHETAEHVVDAFLADSSPEDLMLVREELNSLLDQRRDEVELREYLLKELSCYYCYWNVWESGELWLRHIASKLDSKTDEHKFVGFLKTFTGCLPLNETDAHYFWG